MLFVFALAFQRMITHTLRTKLMFNGTFCAQPVFKLVFAPGLLSKHSRVTFLRVNGPVARVNENVGITRFHETGLT